MLTRRMFIFAAALLLATGAAAQELSLDQILDKNLQALGGAEAVKAVQSLKASGKMIMGGGMMEAPMVMQVKRPGKARMDITVQGQQIISAVDGAEGWMVNPLQGSKDPQNLPEDQLKQMKESAEMKSAIGALKFMRDAGSTLELAGKETSKAHLHTASRSPGRTAIFGLNSSMPRSSSR